MIYGASTAIGHFAVQLAARSNIHPLICIAGASSALLDDLLDRSQGDVIIDYRQDMAKIVAAINEAAKGVQLLHAFDCVSEHGSFQTLSKVLSPGAKLATVLPFQDYSSIPSHITHLEVDVLGYQKTWAEFGFVFFRYIARGLREGWFKPHPFEALPGGLNAVSEALRKLKAGEARGVKYVLQVAKE